MPAATHEYALTILERHLDTFGHVNNAVYLEILEEARWDWVTRGGFGLEEIRRLQQGPTVLECKIVFRRELGAREKVVVASTPLEYVGKIARLSQQIRRAESGEVCCEAELVLALFDLRTRKLIAPTPQWLAALGVTETYRLKA